MKIRNGFVSNSSSSSFVIKKEDLSEEQIEILLNLYDSENPNTNYKKNEKYHKILEEEGGIGDFWDIIEDPDQTISGSTVVDNGFLFEFMKKINIDLNKVEWED